MKPNDNLVRAVLFALALQITSSEAVCANETERAIDVLRSYVDNMTFAELRLYAVTKIQTTEGGAWVEAERETIHTLCDAERKRLRLTLDTENRFRNGRPTRKFFVEQVTLDGTFLQFYKKGSAEEDVEGTLQTDSDATVKSEWTRGYGQVVPACFSGAFRGWKAENIGWLSLLQAASPVLTNPRRGLIQLSCDGESWTLLVAFHTDDGYRPSTIEYSATERQGDVTRRLQVSEEAFDLRKDSNIWIPGRVVHRRTLFESPAQNANGRATKDRTSWTLKRNFEREYTLLRADVQPDFQESDFQLKTPIPDGTKVVYRNALHVSAEWKDGKPVQTVADYILKQAESAAEFQKPTGVKGRMQVLIGANVVLIIMVVAWIMWRRR